MEPEHRGEQEEQAAAPDRAARFPRQYWKKFEWPENPDATEFDDEEAGCCRSRSRAAAKEDPPSLSARSEAAFNDLWDTKDPAFLDKVCCRAIVKVTAIDAKSSRFELRMKCHWKFRTLHSEERTETRLRVPGIRMPGLVVTVEESRIWRDMQRVKGSKHTLFWRGVSVFTIYGYERFELKRFPYDRQIVSLDLLEFVWRENKDSAEYAFSMQICAFSLVVVSMLPEWKEYRSIIEADNPSHNRRVEDSIALPRSGLMSSDSVASQTLLSNRTAADDEDPPGYASRFSVKLRLERINGFYVSQVFFLSILITLMSSLPLALPPDTESVGDRLSLYGSGILTLTAFKYGISDKLPNVPYSTVFDYVCFAELLSLILLSVEALAVYTHVESADGATNETEVCGTLFSPKIDTELMLVDRWEKFLLVLLVLTWSFVGLCLAADSWGWTLCCRMRPESWEYILTHQEQDMQDDELTSSGVHHVELTPEQRAELHAKVLALEDVNGRIRLELAKKRLPGADVDGVKRTVADLQRRRNDLEAEIARLENVSPEIEELAQRPSLFSLSDHTEDEMPASP